MAASVEPALEVAGPGGLPAGLTPAGRLAVGPASFAVCMAFAVYLGLARLSLVWLFEGADIQAFWPATAAVIALTLAFPHSLRGALIVGALAGQLVNSIAFFHDGPWDVTVALVANLVELMVVPPVLARLVAPHGQLEYVRRAVAWLGIASVGALAAGVVAGASTGVDDRVDFTLRWILGDFVALVVIAPLGTLLHTRPIVPLRRWAAVELAGVAALLAVATVGAFATDRPLPYLTVPLVVWLAIRFGPVVSIPAVLSVVLYATLRTADGAGSFTVTDGDPVLQLQAFNVALGVSVLLTGAHAVRAANERSRLRQEIDERRRLEASLEHIRVDEQRRLARRLHDDAVQVLVAADLQLGIARRDPPLGGSERLEAVGAMIRAAIDELRASITELGAHAEGTDLVAGIEAVVTRWQAGSGLAIHCDLVPVDTVDAAVGRVLYQVAREAIANAVLHSHGRRVDVRLFPRVDELVVEVSDDGDGPGPALEHEGRAGHLGVRLMHERTMALGGALDIVPRPAGGTTVRAAVPLRASEPGRPAGPR